MHRLRQLLRLSAVAGIFVVLETASGCGSSFSGVDGSGSDSGPADGSPNGTADAGDASADGSPDVADGMVGDAFSDAPPDGANCEAGLVVCGGQCVDPNSPAHCGSSCTGCPIPDAGTGQATCTGGVCNVMCSSGYVACNGQCLPDSDGPSGNPCIISESYGIFVSPVGKDSNMGTQVAPVQTLGHAMDLAKAQGKRVYACGSNGTFTENLVVDPSRDGVNVYGGLNCTTTPSQWTYSATAIATLAPGSGYALQAQGLTTGVAFTDFGFQAASAVATPPSSGPGASSIAVLVNGASGVLFTRSKFVAGNGQPGGNGLLSPFTFPAAAALHGNSGTDIAGGAAQPVTCPSGSVTTGGKGGDPPTGDGVAGQPSLGAGGAGSSAQCAASTGGNGGNGASSQGGGNGLGASTVGTLSGTNWQPSGGGPGSAGGVGQGGGGGGATATGGGGGGGAGGCGGAGGGAGSGGGASVAVLAINATSLTFNVCTIVTGTGGTGGAGVAGQSGQSPGGTRGSPGANGGCIGGSGGSGGSGGAGGGGAGGPSIGILYTSTPPTLDASTQTSFQQGQSGAKGLGGATPANDGVPGTQGLAVLAP
jgi:hypothetical protein